MGRWSGRVDGEYSFGDGGRSVTLRPRRPLSSGELVLVIISHDVMGEDGSALRGAGHSFQFWTRTRPGRLAFEERGTLTARSSPGTAVRTYGGTAGDYNADGFLDLAVVNEDSGDLRVFLNRADGSGLLRPFTEPPTPIGFGASPSETADFNGDGRADICVSNGTDQSVSILLGNGNGTFGPAQNIAAGRSPRGIAVLDVDGDGDVDIANASSDEGNLAVMINDGRGRFGAPRFFDSGGEGEWALTTADMNADGVMDLVVGAEASRQVIVMAGNGDGTFTRASAVDAGGAVWMTAVGDLDGNGTADVAAANNRSDSAAVLLGDGRGGLTRAQTPSISSPLASDLGDVDGDGDLDWILSSFSGSWTILNNDGRGVFSEAFTAQAPNAGSCAIAFDADGDGDLDLALVDEIADVIILLRNAG